MDAHTTKLVRAARRTCQRHSYTGVPVVQTPWPVRPLFIPRGHSQQSRLHPLRHALAVAEEVDLDTQHRIGGIVDTPTDRLLADVANTNNHDAPDPNDDVPLSELMEAWG